MLCLFCSWLNPNLKRENFRTEACQAKEPPRFDAAASRTERYEPRKNADGYYIENRKQVKLCDDWQAGKCPSHGRKDGVCMQHAGLRHQCGICLSPEHGVSGRPGKQAVQEQRKGAGKGKGKGKSLPPKAYEDCTRDEQWWLWQLWSGRLAAELEEAEQLCSRVQAKDFNVFDYD